MGVGQQQSPKNEANNGRRVESSGRRCHQHGSSGICQIGGGKFEEKMRGVFDGRWRPFRVFFEIVIKSEHVCIKLVVLIWYYIAYCYFYIVFLYLSWRETPCIAMIKCKYFNEIRNLFDFSQLKQKRFFFSSKLSSPNISRFFCLMIVVFIVSFFPII